MDLKQIKADRDNGVIISRCTWDTVLDRAIAMSEALNHIAELYEDNTSGNSIYQARLLYDARCIARTVLLDTAAIGKPDGEGA